MGLGELKEPYSIRPTCFGLPSLFSPFGEVAKAQLLQMGRCIQDQNPRTLYRRVSPKVRNSGFSLSRCALSLILSLVMALAAGSVPASESAKNAGQIAIADLPQEGRDTLALVKRGGPFRHRQDGSVFGNREQRLPPKERGYYREYTVPTPGAKDRGARRIVAGSGRAGEERTSGEYYYSNDHYNSFRRIKE